MCQQIKARKAKRLFAAVCMLMVCMSGFAQSQAVRISGNRNTLKSVFQQIEQQTKLSIDYDAKDLDVARVVPSSVTGKTLQSVLDEVLPEKDYQVLYQGSHIIIKKNAEKRSDNVLSGKILDENGQPAIGAGVIVKGVPGLGTVADINGNFSLQVNPGSVLEISSVGYKSQEVTVGNDRNIVIRLSEDTESLDEVVVVGYGTQKKVNLTGSVSYVKFDDKMNSRPLTSVSTALNGMSSGVSVAQTSGQPGTSATINVRGIGTLNNNTPLVLVDGIEWSMDNVNPADIESISILKDASSTAIYGALGANGVILITTKKGNGAPKFVYNGYVSAENVINRLGLVSDYVEYMELANESAYQRDLGDYFSSATIEMWKNANAHPDATNSYGVKNSIAYPNTDWFDTIFNTGFAQNHHIAMSGSTEKMNYSLSLGFRDNPGVMNVAEGVTSGEKKITFQSRVEGKAGRNNWLTLGANVQGNRANQGMANVSQLFSYLTLATPGIYPGGENHVYGTSVIAEESSNANNLLQTSDRGGEDISQNLNLSGYFTANIIKGLTLEGKYNFQQYTRDYSTWGVPFVSRNFATGVDTWTNSLASSDISHSDTKTERQTVELLARYMQTFGDHEIGAIAGYNAQWYDYSISSATRHGMTDWTLHDLSTATSLQSISGSSTAWRMMSFFGRVNYSYKGKYLAEANLRYDGSSQFAPESRWGLFPSVSAGWRISEEPFMASAKNWLSNLKIRASYGTVGNNRTDNYAWQAVYGVAGVVVGGSEVSGLKVTKLGNTGLKWESTTTADLGVDFGLFSDKLTGEVDVYNKNTSGILFTPSLYLTMGTKTGATENLAEVNNKGLELTLKYSNRAGDLFYSVGGNFSVNKNLVTKYKGALNKGWNADKTAYTNNFGEVAQSGFSGYICEGHMLGETYLKKVYNGDGSYYNADGSVNINGGPTDGMIRTDKDYQWVQDMIAAGYKFEGKTLTKRNNLYYGDLIYADANGDGNYGDTNDQNFTGHSITPKTHFGFNVSLAYKGFDFYALFSGAAGFYIYYQPNMTIQPGYNCYKYLADDHYFYEPGLTTSWTNTSATYPRLGGTNSSTSQFWEYKGDYLKLKNIQLGYTIPASITQRASIDKLRVYLSADNLFTITGYPGMDPELGSSVTYPIMRMYAFGVQLSF